jgi:hypothetical protein
MTSAKVISSILAATGLLGATAACTPRSNSANDIADEVGKALDPAPDYVDPPAAEPQKPQ